MMDDIDFAVLGTGGIGRRALEYSKSKDDLTPVAACDRNGVAVDHDGLDVDELLAATEGNIASEAGASDASGEDADPRPDGGTAVKRSGEMQGVAASTQADPTETPIDDIIAESDAIDAVLVALPNLEHDFIPRVGERFAEAGYEGVLVDVLKRSRVIDILDDREATFEESGITFVCRCRPCRVPQMSPRP